MQIENVNLYAVSSGMLREDLHAVMITYTCTSQSTPILHVGNGYRWIYFNDLLNYDFALLDKPVINKMLSSNNYS